MRRDSDGFDLEEMMRILGETPSGAEPRAPLAVDGDPPPGVLTPEEQALLDEYEAARLRRRLEEKAELVRRQLEEREREARRIIEEYERQAAGAVSPPPVGLADIGPAECEALGALLEGIRLALFSYLVPRIGAKNAVSMLVKSLERVRAAAPDVLKDVSWRPDGTLREDGSVDSARLLKNAAALPQGERVSRVLGAMRELWALRLKSVEAGLGAQVRGEIEGRLKATRADPANARVPRSWLDAFYDGVLA